MTTARRTLLRRIAIGAIVLLALGGLLARWLLPRRVAVVEVKRGEVRQSVVVSGRVLAPSRVSLGTTIGGVIAEVRADEGQRVAAGDLLVSLRSAELEASVEQAGAALARARSRAMQLSGVTVRVAEADLARVETEQKKAERDLNLTQALSASGAATEQQLLDARTTVDRVKSAIEAARARLSDAAPGGSEAQALQSAMLEARAALRAAEARLALTRIVAPAPGVILSRKAEPGDVIAPGQALLVLAVDGPTRVLVQPDESSLSLLAVGHPARVAADAFPQQPFDARVEYIAPGVDAARGTIDVRLLVPKPPGFLRWDMTVSASIDLGRKQGALTVLRDAVRDPDGRAPFVLVVASGRVERREVKVGLRGGTTIEIADGVREGDLAIVEPKPPAPGTAVRAAPRASR